MSYGVHNRKSASAECVYAPAAERMAVRPPVADDLANTGSHTMVNSNAAWIASGAKWIIQRGSETRPNCYLRFVRRFVAHKNDKIVIHISAVSQYEFYVNGQWIGRGPAPSCAALYYFHSYILPPDALRDGENLLAVMLYHPGNNVKTAQGFDYGQPGLLCRLETTQATLVTDCSWQVAASDVYAGHVMATGNSMVSLWGGYKELYHGEREDHWTRLDYDHSSWEPAVEVAEAISADFVQNLVALDVRELESHRVLPVRIVDASSNLGHNNLDLLEMPAPYTHQPITVTGREYGATPSVTLDFGAMVVGYPEIEVEGEFYIYELWYGESLDLYRLDVIRKPKQGVWRAFQRRAFRYLKINFIALEGPATIKNVLIHNTWYAYNSQGLARTSDARINQILNISRHTQRVNTSYHFEDCPWREQALWVFDMRAMALTNYYSFGNGELVANNLRRMFVLQKPDGGIPPVGPRENELFFLDYCLHLISALKEYYQYSGDVRLVGELFAPLRRLVEFVNRYKTADGLLDSEAREPGHVFFEWAPGLDKKGTSIFLNGLYSQCLNDLAVLYRVGGADGSEFLQERELLKDNVHRRLFDSGKGLYRDTCSQGQLSGKMSFLGNMAALYGEFVPPGKVDLLLSRIRSEWGHSETYTSIFHLVIFEAMAKAGQYQAILEQIERYWGGMLARGATTWWEVFDPQTPHWVYPHPYLGNTFAYEKDWIPVSTCHGWSTIPAYAIPRYVFGIDLFQMPDHKVVVRPPAPARFERFTYKLPLADQLLHLEFQARNGKYDIDVRQTPDKITVEIVE